MANKILSYTWEHSKQKGSALLMLIALADQANDHGVSFPATDTLAKKCRVTRRQAQRLVDQLEESGEIIIYNREDTEHPHHFYSNIYVIPVPGIEPVFPDIKGEYKRRGKTTHSDTHVTTTRSHNDTRTMRNSDTDDTTIVTPMSLSSDAYVTEIVTPMSPDPLLNHQSNPQIEPKEIAPNGAHQPNPPSKPESSKPKKVTAHEPEFNALALANGHNPDVLRKSKGAASNYWAVAADLHAINFPIERIPELRDYCKEKARREGWSSLTVNVLGKYALDFIRDNGVLPPPASPRGNGQPPPAAAAPGSTHGVGLPPSAFIKRQKETP